VTPRVRPGPGLGGELVEHPETFLTTADVERIRRDERRATVERLREKLHLTDFDYDDPIDKADRIFAAVVARYLEQEARR
jgi:hypothetical protein